MSFVLHVKATSLHIKYDSLSSLTFKLLYIILYGPKVVVNIDVDNKTEWLQGDHLKENMPMAESQISAVDPVAHHVHHLTSTSHPWETATDLKGDSGKLYSCSLMAQNWGLKHLWLWASS